MEAYTVGYRPTYDDSLAGEDPPTKLGRTGDYQGGWVWRNAQEAQHFLGSAHFRRAFPARDPGTFGVYVLELPGSWEQCVGQDPDPGDGVHRLLQDARILRRAVLS